MTPVGKDKMFEPVHEILVHSREDSDKPVQMLSPTRVIAACIYKVARSLAPTG